MFYPALDLAGYQLRTEVPASYVTDVEALVPGFTVEKIAAATSRVYAQLRKRYGNTLPFLSAPPLDAVGTAPPAVALSGVPQLGSLRIQIGITSPGALGTAGFRWSLDGGNTFAGGGTTAASFSLLGTGLAVLFPVGTYATDNVYNAPTPTPRIVLEWIARLVDVAILKKHGANPQDPEIADFREAAKTALDELALAANSKDGLFDLPPVDGETPTNISTGGPISYSEAGSPFVSADRQEWDGRCEDERGFGTFSGGSFDTGAGWCP